MPARTAPCSNNPAQLNASRIRPTSKDGETENGGEGVIVTEGEPSAGFALYVQDGKLVYHYNWFDEERSIITSSETVPPGKSTVRFEFAYDGGGPGKGGNGALSINGKKVGEQRIEKTVEARFGIDTFGLGADTGLPVSNTYKPPFAFNGEVTEVTIDLGKM